MDTTTITSGNYRFELRDGMVNVLTAGSRNLIDRFPLGDDDLPAVADAWIKEWVTGWGYPS